jgi:hypothetical protein
MTMGFHERFWGDYDYVIEATRIKQLADEYDCAAKVVRMMRRQRGQRPEDVNVLQFGEQWGTTEVDAVKKVDDNVKSWIQRQESN